MLFVASDKGFAQHAKTCSLGMFFGLKSNCLLLQNHANRTVHPSKIEDKLSMVYVLLHVSQRPPFWSPEPCLGPSKQYPTSMFFGTWYKVFISARLGVSWGSNLDHFWHASWRYPGAQIQFFCGPGPYQVSFRSQVVSGPDFGRYLEPLLSVVS